MSSQPYIVETAVLLLLAFVIGGVVGYFARRWFAPATLADPAPASASAVETTENAPMPEPTPASEPEPEPEPKPAPEPEPAPAPAADAPGDADKPAMLDGARDGKPDNLKKIKGIGPKIETTLNGLGVYHYDQIAAWDEKAIAWVDEQLSFHGRIQREDWVAQARELAKG